MRFKTKEIIFGMRAWFREQKTPKFTYPDMRAVDSASRTDQQKIWDHAIFAASEFIRRYTGDEGLAGQVHGLLSVELPGDPPDD